VAAQSAPVGLVIAAIGFVGSGILLSQKTAMAGLAPMFGTLLLLFSLAVATVAVVGAIGRGIKALLGAASGKQPTARTRRATQTSEKWVTARSTWRPPGAAGTAATTSAAPNSVPFASAGASLLSNGELAFYHPLRDIVAGRFEIHVKPSLADVIQCRSHPQFRAIAAMHVDFLLCERDTLRPRLAIELDDHSHWDPTRAAADRWKEELLREAGIPLLRQACCTAYDVQELRERIELTSLPRP
jgi:hypothetical protein